MAEAVTQLSYLEYVRALVGRFPRLQLLADFTSPDIRISDYHSNEDVARRMTKVDVTVVDLGPFSVESGQFNDLSSLAGHLHCKLPSGSLRVIIIEDLSRDVIELLGSKFSLDPRFFENHLRGIQTYLTDRWTGDRTPRVESPKSEVLSREFLTVDFARPYQFRGWSLAYTSRVKVNVPRFGGVVRNLYLKERASLYGPIKTGEGCSICRCYTTCPYIGASDSQTNGVYKIWSYATLYSMTAYLMAFTSETTIRYHDTAPIFTRSRLLFEIDKNQLGQC
jgi:hypothetical protein